MCDDRIVIKKDSLSPKTKKMIKDFFETRDKDKQLVITPSKVEVKTIGAKE
jgi:hypothetical protein